MKHITLLFLLTITITINVVAQMERFPLLEPISNTIPESFIIEGDTNELIMFWIDSTDLHISKSLDEGANWNTPTTLVDKEAVFDSLSDLNVLKLKSGRLLLTYKSKFHYSIYSDDNGLTWSEPIQLITDTGIIRPRKVMESSLSQTEDSKIWFVYNRLNVIYNIQSDDGINWSEKDTLFVVDSGAPHFSSVNSHWNGSLLLIFQQTVGDTSQLMEATSNDNGLTWSDTKVIFESENNEQRPRIKRDSNKDLWITYTKSEETPFEEYTQSNIYFSKLPSGAYSWGISNKFTEFVNFDGWQNISIINNKPYISFTSNRVVDLGLWYGIAGVSVDNTTPPAIYNTDLRFTNNYPKAIINVNSKVYSKNVISSVIFNYLQGAVETSIQLFDDGLHNDKEAGDYIFGNDITNLNYDFTFDNYTEATDEYGNSSIVIGEEVKSPFVEDGGDTFAFDNNNIWFPIDSEGVLADVEIINSEGNKEKGIHFDENMVVYSAGFEITGYTNGTLWGNGVASASRMADYIHGPIDSVESLNQIHVVRSSQPDFYQSWINWKDAVKEGADFYDGDGDGIYNPVDLNGNGAWDENEDKPDILGDITAFTTYNDGLESRYRTYPNVEPQGIEINQTVFSYNSATSPKLSNVIFVRYKVENMGTVADRLDSVYFSAWVDADIGKYYDDLVGTDSTLNSFYSYNHDTDEYFGINAPACFTTFLQAPPIYIANKTYSDINENGIYDEGTDTPLDSAFNKKGKLLGVDFHPGAKNNKLTASIHYVASHPTQGDPDNESQLHNYMLGLNQSGVLLNPCEWEYGDIFNIDCNSINPSLMYSGDPVTQNGWVNRASFDQRQLGSTGPFDLVKGKPIEIIVAYIIGRGSNSLNSITEAQKITNDVIGFYNTNFSYVPVGVRENTTSQFPTEFELMQNYPNPFNPSTTIKYSIPLNVSRESSIVSLKVYDILGREVVTLVNKEQKAGSYEVTFDASHLTSGVYFYRLHASTSSASIFMKSKKMILLK
jgi:hypothetical protein